MTNKQEYFLEPYTDSIVLGDTSIEVRLPDPIPHIGGHQLAPGTVEVAEIPAAAAEGFTASKKRPTSMGPSPTQSELEKYFQISI